MAREIPDLVELLAPLEGACARLGELWHPDDPAAAAELARQTLASFSYSYFAYFHATPEHPDWAPLWNPVYTLQPNPDDIYWQSPIRGDLRYRVAGNRGTCRILSFTTQRFLSGTVDELPRDNGHREVDDADLELALGEEFEVLFAAERPRGWRGRYAPIDPQAGGMMVRARMYDWEREVDPVLTIECLDPVPPKPRPDAAEILRRIGEMAHFPARKTGLYFAMQNGIRERVGYNVFEPVRYVGALAKQVYWPACFQLAPGEALVIESDLPRRCRYWNIQVNDPYFNAVEYVYRFASLNGAQAHLASDGRLYAVVALEDPGVPNWLDPGGFTEGTLYGRWYDADEAPTPKIHRVPLGEVRDLLPPDTPRVTPEARAAALRRRVRAAQRRRRW